MTLSHRHNVIGTLVSAVDYAQATELLISAARDGLSVAASALAVHALGLARRDPDFRRKLNALDLATPDGQPVRWALDWLHHTRLRDRVYGPFLMREVCLAAGGAGLPIFLFGATDTTLRQLRSTLHRWDARIRIAGMQASRFRRITAEEARTDAHAIIASGAKLVFCGLGCPRQEHWVHAMKPLLPMPTLAVGAAFALWAGERTMAPGWMQRAGLEWLYRLGQEPCRLGARYLVHNPAFAAAVVAQRCGRTFPVDAGDAPPAYWG